MNKIIDVHSHFIIPEYMETLIAHGREMEDGFPSPKWDEEAHLAFMDEAGIDCCVLSVSSPHFYSGDGEEAKRLGQLMDEKAFELKKKYPGRFLYAASLPAPDMQACIEAMNRAYDEYEADAVKLPSNADGIYLGDPAYDELFDAMNKRKVILLIHPCAPKVVPGGCFTAGPLPLMEFIADTTRAVVNLIATGTLEKYPDIKVIVPHAGSYLPNLIDRLTGITRLLSTKGVCPAVDVQKSLKSLYFDVSGDVLPRGIDILMSLTDEDHVMFGGDYPYTPKEIIVGKVNALKTEPKVAAYLDKLMYKNAEKLFAEN